MTWNCMFGKKLFRKLETDVTDVTDVDTAQLLIF